MLTAQQTSIIQQPPRHTVVFAAPGSGKTTVLTHHIAWQIQCTGLLPKEVLALTFTRQSAIDMKRRMLAQLALPRGTLATLHLGTFHAQAFRLLLQERPNIPVVLSPAEQLTLMKTAAKSVGVVRQGDAQRFLLAQTRAVATWPPEAPSSRRIKRVLERYQALKHRLQRWDYDDILLEFADRLNQQPELVSGLRYLLVDEYQDTNALQWHLVEQIAKAADCPVFVVGDDDQSIYGFRGASPAGLLSFSSKFAGAREHLLTVNFRSDRLIVHSASRLIQRNTNRQAKPVDIHSSLPGVCETHAWKSEEQEAAQVCSLVREAWAKDSRTEIAVLARTRRQLAVCFSVFADGQKPQFRTFHDAKGKEWDIVHVIGAVHHNPFLASDRNRHAALHANADSEEERRLFYVAMTRARHELHIHVPFHLTGFKQKPATYLHEAGLSVPVRHTAHGASRSME